MNKPAQVSKIPANAAASHASRRASASRRTAFTLVELLAVIAIVALIGAVVLAINASPPQSLANAQSAASTFFRAARLKSQSPLPNLDKRELYNPRSRVIILNDKDAPDEHLRLMRILIGGTLESTQNPKPADYLWFDTEHQYTLPKGIFMVDDTAIVQGGGEGFTEERRSHISYKETPGVNEMRKDYKTSVKVPQKDSAGDRTWYFYEFDSDGTSNMSAAKFIVGEGVFIPRSSNVTFKNIYSIAGFFITPSGENVLYNDSDEMREQQK